jgi:hypothetical protein
MRLTLSKETLVELTADDMAAVVGGAEDSNSCSIASCVTNYFAMPGGGSTPGTLNICDIKN